MENSRTYFGAPDTGFIEEGGRLNSCQSAVVPSPAAQPPRSVNDVIYKTRSVRSYSSATVPRRTIEVLLRAAVQAPTAMHSEPWAFLVVQDAALLRMITEESMSAEQNGFHDVNISARNCDHSIQTPGTEIMHGASALIVIYRRPFGSMGEADCWLAAQNIVLTASDEGLGSCIIGSAVKALNRDNVKDALGVPQNYTAVAPIVIGYPKGKAVIGRRNEPFIIGWR